MLWPGLSIIWQNYQDMMHTRLRDMVPLRSGNMGVHSWVEIDMNGSTYVFDPDFTHESGRNGYQISYGMSGTWRYSNYYRMN